MALSLRYHISFIRETGSTLNKNWVINISSKLTILLFIVQCIALIISWKKLPPLVPLWYSLPWGDEQLTKPLFLIILPLSSIIWQICANLTNVYIVRDHLIFAQIVSLASFLVSLFSCIILFTIISLVT